MTAKKKNPVLFTIGVTVFCVLLVFLFFASSLKTVSAQVTAEQAVEISKGSPQVQALLAEYPDSVATTDSVTCNAVDCWRVTWWSPQRQSGKLDYPNVLVYISVEEAEIVGTIIPTGAIPKDATQPYPKPYAPTMAEEDTQNQSLFSAREWIILSLSCAAVGFAAYMMISKIRRRA